MHNRDSFIVYAREVIPDKTRAELEKEWSLLTKNLRLIIDNSHKIIQQQKYFHILISAAEISASFLGSRKIPLGVLLLLWKDGLLKDICPICGGEAYIIKAAGSILIGNNKWHGYCTECDEKVSGKCVNFLNVWRPAFDLKKRYSNYAIIKRYNLKSENWFDKLKETRRADEVFKERVKESSLDELINYLQSL